MPHWSDNNCIDEVSETPSAGVGVVPGSGDTPTPAPPGPETLPGSGRCTGPEGAAEPSMPFAGVGGVPGSGDTPTPAPPGPETVPGSGRCTGPEGAAEPSAPYAGVDVAPGSGATPTPARPPPVTSTDADRPSSYRYQWPLVKCSTPGCPTIANVMKKMTSKEVFTRFQTEADDQWHWDCLLCILQQNTCSETEAKAILAEHHPFARDARVPNVKYRHALKLVLNEIEEMLTPFSEFVFRKLKQLAVRESGVAKHMKLVEELKGCRDKKREIELVQLLEEWDVMLADLLKPLALADQGEEKQTGLMNGAQYSDEWLKTEHGSLRAQYSDVWLKTEHGIIRSWYLCMHDWNGTEPTCGCLMPSQQLGETYADTSSMRWYCVSCNARYKIKYGMLVEFHTNGISTFMRAEVINNDVEDIRALYLEDTLWHTEPLTAADLYEKLPVVLPMDPTDILRPATQKDINKEGVEPDNIMFLLNPDKLKELPKWEWDQIFKLLQPRTGVKTLSCVSLGLLP